MHGSEPHNTFEPAIFHQVQNAREEKKHLFPVVRVYCDANSINSLITINNECGTLVTRVERFNQCPALCQPAQQEDVKVTAPSLCELVKAFNEITLLTVWWFDMLIY